MKNLIVLYNVKYQIPVDNPELLIVDPDDTNNIFVANKYSIFCYNSGNKHFEKIYELTNQDDGKIVSFEYLSLSNDIVFATDTGLVKVVNLLHKSSEEVTFCDGGIKNMSWSPDQEVVVFVTNAKMLVVMSCSYDPISESSLEDMSSFGDGEFITVGWGKKETQFHGSVGKQAAKEKMKFEMPNNINELPQNINISWRADGELFTVSFVGTYGRMFKVYNREGMLQYTSEKLNELGECIAWRPSGNWIAVPHKLPNKYTIGLFEKNGLRHREIVLPFTQESESVKRLSWSNDSEILIVETAKEEKYDFYFFTMSNYFWYLKYFLSFKSKVSGLVWDCGIKQNKKLHMLTETGEYIVSRFYFANHFSKGENEINQAVVAVVEGKNLLLTDFRNRIVPPPMSSYKYQHQTYINVCGFLQNSLTNSNLNKLFIVDSEDVIYFFELEFENGSYSNSLKSLKQIDSKKIENISSAHNFLWINENQFIFCSTKNEVSKVCLVQLGIESKSVNIFLSDSLIGNIASVNSNTFLADFTHGETQKFTIYEDCIKNVGLFTNEGCYCEKIQCVIRNEAIKLIGLNDFNNLYINGVKIAEDVTSFLSLGNYIIFTQMNCIKFYHFDYSKIVDERKMERGGKLVTIVPNDSRTILQMPRGNLEVICPRILSLEIVGKFLNSLQYFKAFDFLRKQRINLNIIFDHNPKKFIENIETFLDEIKSENWLNLFISDLQNDDCTKTMFQGNYIEYNYEYPDNFKATEKIKYICEKLCQKMEERDEILYVLPIITTYVKMGNLEKCLEIIWKEKKLEHSKFGGEQIEKSLSEKALKYLLYLVDVNDLYNVALGMYDFGLVLFIASKSQKDPKEYIPFLNELKKYEENYRKFKIDLHLKRYEKALENISKSTDSEKFDEVLDFIAEKKLFQKALQCYQNQFDQYKKICKAFADYLRGQGKLQNASVMYERAGDLQQAIASARHVGDWKRCLGMAKTLYNSDKDQMKNLALSLAVTLEEKGKYDDSFYILKNFAENNQRSIESLLKGKLFYKALYESKMASKDNVSLANMVRNEIVNYFEYLTSAINTDITTFSKYKDRLAVVRKLRTEKDENDDYIENGIDECDLLSDTTSVNSSRYTKSSRGTGKTFRSSKNRRKHERKLLSLKEGNPFEDVALIDATYNLIIKILNQQQHIHDFCQSLIEIGRDDLGRNIQKQYKLLLILIKESLDAIWIPEMQTNTPQLIGNNIDYVQFQNAQHYSVLNPVKRFKPELNIIDWEHEILR